MFGFCEKPELQANFDASQYAGKWYEIERESKFIQEKNGECVTAEYTLNDDGSIKVFNSMFNTKKNERENAEARATCEGAKCVVKFNPLAKGDYRVVSTDYTTYSIVYSCQGFLGIKVENLWLLSREQTLEQEAYDNAKSIMAAQLPKYKQERQYKTKQGGDCTY